MKVSLDKIKQVNYRKLGHSDINISEVSFGCMSLDWSNTESERLLHSAIDYGVNFFDTADLYDGGKNETLLGNALKEHRKGIILATKVGNQLRPDGSDWDWNPSRDYIVNAVEQSLKRLQTDYIDLYQLHGGTIEDPIDEIIDAFEILQKEGKIRYYGISSIRPNVIREYVDRSNITSVMMQYNLLDRRAEETCLQLLDENNIGVLARGTLAKGLLAGKPAKEYLGYTETEVQNTIDVLKEATASDQPIGRTAMQYVLQHPAISSAVLGIRSQKQLEEGFSLSHSISLSNEIFAVLGKSNTPKIYAQHR
ncbi:Predicted oxidoreductase [Aquimarina spongiae]|uniref:Predicted oxidoreductase n=1 Tax=Aquimarina spongiae TaxID=570521 RepID=A0A1M6JU06_9FLAO|nr:Predicted oxidoreductase [Aquimarina spongiae]